MVSLAFSLFDVKAQMFNVPFFFPSAGQAFRACVDLAGDASTLVGRHPGDFVLYQVGSFDDSKGEFLPQIPANLGSVESFLVPRVVEGVK